VLPALAVTYVLYCSFVVAVVCGRTRRVHRCLAGPADPFECSSRRARHLVVCVSMAIPYAHRRTLGAELSTLRAYALGWPS